MSRTTLSVVAPCYNEESVLDEFYQRVTDACRQLTDQYEIVLVNDGSRDGTWTRLSALAAVDPHVVLVNLSRNHGHQLALTAGLSVCQGERVLIIDADLQDPPELLGPMMAVMDRGADVVYGQRRQRQGETRFKLATAAAFYRILSKLSDTQIPRDTGDFRLISRRALDVLQAMPERHRFIRGMVSWIGFRQEPFPYDRAPRFAGQTKYPFVRMLRFSIDAITAFSTRPLVLAIWLAMATALFGGAMLAWALYSWVVGITVTGWTTVICAMSLLSSGQLLMLGIMGEYLGRLYEQSKGRPLFIIERVVRAGMPTRGGSWADSPMGFKPSEPLEG